MFYELTGIFTWKIIRNGVVIYESQPQHNLILNQGFDYVAKFTFASCMKYCVVGNGTNSPIETDVGLESELARSSTYLTDDGANGCALEDRTYSIFRTYTFTPFGEAVSIGEIGLSPYADSGNNLFSKALLRDSDGEITAAELEPTDTFVIKYTLSIKLQKPIEKKESIFETEGTGGELHYQLVGLSGVNASGQEIYFDNAQNCNEPSSKCRIFVSQNGEYPALLGFSLSRGGPTVKAGPTGYVNGTYSLKKVGIFQNTKMLTSWNSIGIGALDESLTNSNNGAVFVYGTTQQNPNKKGFMAEFTFGWGRKLPKIGDKSIFIHWLDGEEIPYQMARKVKRNAMSYFGL